MIKIEKTEVMGWEAAIRGMRNPKNSWGLSDSAIPITNLRINNVSIINGGLIETNLSGEKNEYHIGPNDHKLMMQLASGGPVHAKYRRMITVYADITAPLYWWKEFDTYKIGTVANSCSTMHKIHDKEFTLEDFSCEHLHNDWEKDMTFRYCLQGVIAHLNKAREKYLETGVKGYWWQMIQLLPSSYNQKRTVMLNYEVLAGIYPMRKDHKLDEWHEFCDWIKSLPYSEIIIGEEK